MFCIIVLKSIPVAARSKTWVGSSLLAETAGSNHVWSCLFLVLMSGRDFFAGLITRPEES